MIIQKKKGLRKGVNQVPRELQRYLRDDLKKAIRVTTDRSIYMYIAGQRTMHGDMLKAVSRVFKKYGVVDFYDEEIEICTKSAH